MYLAAIIALAGAAQQIVPSDYRLPPQRRNPIERGCDAGEGGDIIVCGRRQQDAYRVGRLPDGTPDTLMRSYEVGSRATLTPEISQTHHDSGAWAGMVDRRVTVSLRVPF